MLHLRFCGIPRYVSAVMILVIHYLKNLFSFLFFHLGVPKKRKPFPNYLSSSEKDQQTAVEGNRNMLHSLLFIICTCNQSKASVAILAADLATFILSSVINPSLSITEWYSGVFIILPSWPNLLYFVPGLNFNHFCLKLN